MKNNALSHNLAWMDVVRIISILLVMYGHYAPVGGFATAIPGIIAKDVHLPLINGAQHIVLQFDTFLINIFSTQSAILGVALFFMVTGYLMPGMMERYSRSEFLINRFFRIFPTLIAATIIVGVYLLLLQGIQYSVSSYLTSWSLSYLFLHTVPVIGVLWTLVIEVTFYLITAAMGKFTKLKLVSLQAGLLIFIALSISHKNFYSEVLVWNAVFMLFITIGAAIFLSKYESGYKEKAALILNSIIFSYVGFQLYKYSVNSTGTYENFGTHFLAVTIFLTLMLLNKQKIFTKIPPIGAWFVDLVYPIYLLHAALGLATMALVRNIYDNYVFMLISAFSVSLLFAWITHIIIEKPFISIGRKLIRTHKSLNEGSLSNKATTSS